MPGRQAPSEPTDTSLCVRCQVGKAAIAVRNQQLCTGCFRKYLSTKVVKRMEMFFRVRDSLPGHEKRLLLPLSLGHCSTVLLQVLSRHLKGQVANTGRTGYRLHILHIDEHDSGNGPLWEQVQQRYPEHDYTSCQAGDLLSSEDLLSLLPPHVQTNAPANEATTDSPSSSLKQALQPLTSATSRADVLQILRQRQIVRFAKSHNCSAILWGHSTTRLAERTLAETAKGRGFSIPWIVNDGDSPFGIPFYYPLRELLSTEIASYASLAEPDLEDLIRKDDPRPAINTKHTTIDELMKQYFATVELEYPSIVANVVRTTGKLQMPALDQVEKHCELCELPLDGRAPDRSRLCYGCIRTLPVVVT